MIRLKDSIAAAVFLAELEEVDIPEGFTVQQVVDLLKAKPAASIPASWTFEFGLQIGVAISRTHFLMLGMEKAAKELEENQ